VYDVGDDGVRRGEVYCDFNLLQQFQVSPRPSWFSWPQSGPDFMSARNGSLGYQRACFTCVPAQGSSRKHLGIDFRKESAMQARDTSVHPLHQSQN